MFARSAAHGFGGRHQHGFARGGQGAGERHQRAGENAGPGFGGGQFDGRGPAGGVERVDGVGDQAHRAACQNAPQQHAERGADHSEEQRFGEE